MQNIEMYIKSIYNSRKNRRKSLFKGMFRIGTSSVKYLVGFRGFRFDTLDD